MRVGPETLLALSLVLSGCGPDVKPPTPTRAIPAATSNLTEAPRINALSSAEIEKYTSQWYPELKGKMPHESGAFQAKEGASIKWLNYTSAKFDQQVAKTMFDYLEENGPLGGLPIINRTTGERKEVPLQRRISIMEKVIFIVPGTILLPGGGEDDIGAINLTSQGQVDAIFIRVRDVSPRPFEEEATYLFASEICKQARDINSSDPSIDARNLLVITCKGVAEGWVAKQKGISFVEYEKLSVSEYQKFNERAYNRIPITGKILTKR